MIISKLEFIDRFTNTEMESILTASDSVPSIRVYIMKLNMVDEIDLLESDTIDGVQSLEDAGVLAVGRASQIINGNVSTNANLPSGKFRVLPPFDEQFTGEYSVIDVVNSPDGTTTYILDNDAGGFDISNLELI